jgi:hypothetical protein
MPAEGWILMARRHVLAVQSASGDKLNGSYTLALRSVQYDDPNHCDDVYVYETLSFIGLHWVS